MAPADWFVLVLRAFGVWRVLAAIDGAVTVFSVSMHLARPEITTAQSYLVQSVTDLFLGAVLLLFAPRICAVFYPARRDATTAPSPKD